jgi:hypothetical protein
MDLVILPLALAGGVIALTLIAPSESLGSSTGDSLAPVVLAPLVPEL